MSQVVWIMGIGCGVLGVLWIAMGLFFRWLMWPLIPRVRNVTREAENGSGFRAGGVYEVRSALFLVAGERKVLYLERTGPGKAQNVRPRGVEMELPSLEAFEAARGKWPSIVGVVSPGVRMRVEKIILRDQRTFRYFEVDTRVQDGAFAGSRVRLEPLGHNSVGTWGPQSVEACLEEVK